MNSCKKKTKSLGDKSSEFRGIAVDAPRYRFTRYVAACHIFILAFSASPPLYSAEFPVAKSGQVVSYATGDDGDLQKGRSWPSPRFTDNGDGTVRDNLTNLVWLKDASCFSFKHTWSQAINNAGGLYDGGQFGEACGLSDGSASGDWRLPTVNELSSLTSVRYHTPALPDGGGYGVWTDGDIFLDVKSDFYWTSTNLPADPGKAFLVWLRYGRVNRDLKTFSAWTWPIRKK